MRVFISCLLCSVLLLAVGCQGGGQGVVDDAESLKGISNGYTISGWLWDPCGTDHGNRVQNRTVTLYDTSVVPYEYVASDTTDSDGDYSFENIDPGDYVVGVSGLFFEGLQTHPRNYYPSVSISDVTLQRFAIYGITTYLISGTITPGEPEVTQKDCEDVEVWAQFWQDSVFGDPGSVVTDENGYYSGYLSDSTYDLLPEKVGFSFVTDGWLEPLHVDGANVANLDWKMYKD